MASIDDLLKIMVQLRDPEQGCPWDRAQSFATIAPYTLEEAYEVDDAIRSGDMADLRDELGDLLFQVVFHAQLAAESGHFDFGDVVEGICDKLVRRHPHVFGDGGSSSAEDLEKAWEEHKQQERTERATRRGQSVADLFDGIPAALPALSRAAKLQKRWERQTDDTPAQPQVRTALEAALACVPAERPSSGRGAEVSAAHERLGALLFEVVRLARASGVDAERALRAFNAVFEAGASSSTGADQAPQPRGPKA
jgi:tetrapyrrole methylase family protein/MazG family protein/ATP diphosphatase